MFSQFWVHLQLAVQHLRSHDIPFCILKGGMSPSGRDLAMNRFQKDPEVRQQICTGERAVC